MPTFLPLTAITRSQAVRIAGQTLKPGKISYVDVGLIDAIGTLTVAQVAKKAGQELVESKFYAYAVTAVGANGGETEVGPLGSKETKAEAETASKIEWTAVPHATKYRIYASPATGAASAAAAEAEALKLIGETAEVEFTDTGQARKATIPPGANTTAYNVGGAAFSTHKELQNHFAIGAVQQLGGYSKTNLRYAPFNEATGFALTFASEEAKIAKAKVVLDRALDIPYKGGTEVAEKKVTAFKSAEAGKITLAIIVFNTTNGLVESITAAEKTVAPASTGAQEYFAAIAKEIKAFQQVLYVIQAKIKVVTNVTATYLTGSSTPTLGDVVNAPFVSTVV